MVSRLSRAAMNRHKRVGSRDPSNRAAVLHGRNRPVYQAGFTLLEVLIAGLILFTAIALVSLAYRTGLQSERSAENRVFKTMAARYIEQDVAEQLRVQPQRTSGEGRWGRWQYEWRVTQRHSKWSKAGFDIETNTVVQVGRPLELLDVLIDVEGEEYAFSYLSWQ